MPQRRTASATADDADAELAMRMVELLKDGRVVQELKKQLYPKELCDKLDVLTAQMDNMTRQLAAKDERIQTLEKTVLHLEGQLDAQEQYSRRSNLRIQGIMDDARGEDVEKKVLGVINKDMGFNPPLKATDLERSHRLGRVAPGQGRPRVVIVRFATERLRDAVYRCRGSLKGYNDAHHPDARIFINEDLTAKRATLAFKTRELKKGGRIAHCWTHSGRVLIKDNDNHIHEVSSPNDLQRFVNA